MKAVPECLAIVVVKGRDERGIAIDFMVLDCDNRKTEALAALNYYKALGFDAILIETYQNKSVSLVKMKDGVPVFEPILSPAENAKFLRSYYGI